MKNKEAGMDKRKRTWGFVWLAALRKAQKGNVFWCKQVEKHSKSQTACPSTQRPVACILKLQLHTIPAWSPQQIVNCPTPAKVERSTLRLGHNMASNKKARIVYERIHFQWFLQLSNVNNSPLRTNVIYILINNHKCLNTLCVAKTVTASWLCCKSVACNQVIWL